MEQDGAVVSVQATVGDVRVEPGFRRRIQRTIARLEDDTGSIDATWFGRRFIERRLPVGGEVVVSGKIKHFGRKLTLDNPEFQVLDRRDGGPPRRPDRAGLPADGGPARRPPAGGHPRGARQGRARLSRVPAGVDPGRGAARADRPGHRGGALPGDVRGSRRRARAARLRRAARAPARAWSSAGASGSATRPRSSPSTTTADDGGPDRARRRDRRAARARPWS